MRKVHNIAQTSLPLALSFFPAPPLTRTLTHARTYVHTLRRCLHLLALFLSFTHGRTLCPSPPSHTHTLSLTHTHTHTHKHTHAYAHTVQTVHTHTCARTHSHFILLCLPKNLSPTLSWLATHQHALFHPPCIPYSSILASSRDGTRQLPTDGDGKNAKHLCK
jgi:hypothetical protein